MLQAFPVVFDLIQTGHDVPKKFFSDKQTNPEEVLEFSLSSTETDKTLQFPKVRD